MHPQGLKKIAADQVRVRSLSVTVAGNVDRSLAARQQAGKHSRSFAQTFVHRIGKRLRAIVHIAPGMPMSRPGRAQNDELFRMRHSQFAQQNLVGQRKDGSVGADAEGEGENGDGGEARGLAKLAEGEAAIREERMEPIVNALLANHP